jgi:SAM-dependent methyltransferase
VTATILLMSAKRRRIFNPNPTQYVASTEDEYINFLYTEIYREFFNIASEFIPTDSARVLELGAGSLTKAHDFFPNLISSDGSEGTKYGKESFLRAERLPFQSNSFELIIAKDTLHHFEDTEKALIEIHRVLSKDGVFIVSEPNWSLFGRFIFRFFHPEKWNPTAKSLKNESPDPTDANQAQLLCLTKQPNSSLVSNALFDLTVMHSTFGLSYILSGGLNWRSKVPSRILCQLYLAERRFPFVLQRITGINRIGIFTKA